MPRKCCVPNCRTGYDSEPKDPNVSVHHFPRDEELREKWLDAIGKPGRSVSDSTCVCSKHFHPDLDFKLESSDKKAYRKGFGTSLRRRILLPEAIPSIFGDDLQRDKAKRGRVRRERAKLREMRKNKLASASETNRCVMMSCTGKRIAKKLAETGELDEEDQITFYPFPMSSSPHYRAWVRAVGRGMAWAPQKTDTVCSLHFTQQDFEWVKIKDTDASLTRKLLPIAVPRVSQQSSSALHKHMGISFTRKRRGGVAKKKQQQPQPQPQPQPPEQQTVVKAEDGPTVTTDEFEATPVAGTLVDEDEEAAEAEEEVQSLDALLSGLQGELMPEEVTLVRREDEVVFYSMQYDQDKGLPFMDYALTVNSAFEVSICKRQTPLDPIILKHLLIRGDVLKISTAWEVAEILHFLKDYRAVPTLMPNEPHNLSREALTEKVLVLMQEILKKSDEESVRRKVCFLGEQIQLMLSGNAGKRYSERTLEFCCKFFSISKPLYKELVWQDLLSLPTPNTIQKRLAGSPKKRKKKTTDGKVSVAGVELEGPLVVSTNASTATTLVVDTSAAAAAHQLQPDVQVHQPEVEVAPIHVDSIVQIQQASIEGEPLIAHESHESDGVTVTVPIKRARLDEDAASSAHHHQHHAAAEATTTQYVEIPIEAADQHAGVVILKEEGSNETRMVYLNVPTSVAAAAAAGEKIEVTTDPQLQATLTQMKPL